VPAVFSYSVIEIGIGSVLEPTKPKTPGEFLIANHNCSLIIALIKT
jgi:hypothetical protein